MEYVLTAIAFMVLAVLLRRAVQHTTILEYERGLKYSSGKYAGVLAAGSYWSMPFFTTIQKLDTRPRFVSITGQEVLSSDGVTLKVSLAANYEVVDPHVAVSSVQSYEGALYLELQLALRNIIGGSDIDTVLSGRGNFSAGLLDRTKTKAEALGLNLISVDLKDIMFPGKLKDIFAQVVSARKEGLAALEKARGETAALRNLANAAKMMEGNPALMQLRLMQTFGSTSGNTLILGMPPDATAVPLSAGKRRPITGDATSAESGDL
jgi:regulator of protease activity HflC (stomatin/prohibitin superfamily)